MRSAEGTDHKSTKSWHQSHQSNASGTSLLHQQNTDNATSDDFSAGFPDNFDMVRRSTYLENNSDQLDFRAAIMDFLS
jgi:hypothetical protein